jgi:hypothetical protein
MLSQIAGFAYQAWNPEFKPQYCQKKQKNKKTLKWQVSCFEKVNNILLCVYIFAYTCPCMHVYTHNFSFCDPEDET